MRAIREVYSPLTETKAEYPQSKLTPQQKTVIEMAEAACDVVFGVSPYHGVLILNRAADYCTGRALATALTDPHSIIAYAEAAGMLGTMADRLDEELMRQTADFFNSKEAN